MSITLTALHRYPVKGLNAETLESVALRPGEGFPGDRAYALAHGSAPWEPAEPRWLPPKYFFTLRNTPRLAQLQAAFDPASGLLSLHRQGRRVASGEVGTPLGRSMIGQFFAGFLGDDGRGVPKLVEAGAAGALADVPDPWISLLNLESVADLARVARGPVDPRRFRANLWMEGPAAWSELEWVGREIAIGDLRLRVVEPIERCAATNVDPETAEVDMNLPLLLRRGYGHLHMGLYCEVLSEGSIARGDTIAVPSAPARSLPF